MFRLGDFNHRIGCFDLPYIFRSPRIRIPPEDSLDVLITAFDGNQRTNSVGFVCPVCGNVGTAGISCPGCGIGRNQLIFD